MLSALRAGALWPRAEGEKTARVYCHFWRFFASMKRPAFATTYTNIFIPFPFPSPPTTRPFLNYPPPHPQPPCSAISHHTWYVQRLWLVVFQGAPPLGCISSTAFPFRNLACRLARIQNRHFLTPSCDSLRVLFPLPGRRVSCHDWQGDAGSTDPGAFCSNGQAPYGRGLFPFENQRCLAPRDNLFVDPQRPAPCPPQAI